MKRSKAEAARIIRKPPSKSKSKKATTSAVPGEPSGDERGHEVDQVPISSEGAEPVQSGDRQVGEGRPEERQATGNIPRLRLHVGSEAAVAPRAERRTKHRSDKGKAVATESSARVPARKRQKTGLVTSDPLSLDTDGEANRRRRMQEIVSDLTPDALTSVPDDLQYIVNTGIDKRASLLSSGSHHSAVQLASNVILPKDAADMMELSPETLCSLATYKVTQAMTACAGLLKQVHKVFDDKVALEVIKDESARLTLELTEQKETLLKEKHELHQKERAMEEEKELLGKKVEFLEATLSESAKRERDSETLRIALEARIRELEDLRVVLEERIQVLGDDLHSALEERAGLLQESSECANLKAQVADMERALTEERQAHESEKEGRAQDKLLFADLHEEGFNDTIRYLSKHYPDAKINWGSISLDHVVDDVSVGDEDDDDDE